MITKPETAWLGFKGHKWQHEIDVRDFIQSNYEILPFDVHASWINSDIRERLEKKGRKAPLADSMIAATAIANNMILVTRNVKDFEDIKEVSALMVENWFEE